MLYPHASQARLQQFIPGSPNRLCQCLPSRLYVKLPALSLMNFPLGTKETLSSAISAIYVTEVQLVHGNLLARAASRRMSFSPVGKLGDGDVLSTKSRVWQTIPTKLKFDIFDPPQRNRTVYALRYFESVKYIGFDTPIPIWISGFPSSLRTLHRSRTPRLTMSDTFTSSHISSGVQRRKAWERVFLSSPRPPCRNSQSTSCPTSNILHRTPLSISRHWVWREVRLDSSHS